MKCLRIRPPANPVHSRIQLPFSKSISARVLLIRAAGELSTPIFHLSDSADTVELQQALHQVSEGLETIDAGNGGTSTRFLLSWLARRPGSYILDGGPQMRQRSIDPLVTALQQAGASIIYLQQAGRLPVAVEGRPLTGGRLAVEASESSQYVSSLLLQAPYFTRGLELEISDQSVSLPYIEMTCRLMREFGVSVTRDSNLLQVEPGRYRGRPFTVEADWSAAAFPASLVALQAGAVIELPGLSASFTQGDSMLVELFRILGVQHRPSTNGLAFYNVAKEANTFYANLSSYPDLFPALACTCAGLGIRARFSGIEHLRGKESDRIAALGAELGKMGVLMNKVAGDYTLEGKVAGGTCRINPHGDHRLAMALALLCIVTGELIMEDPDCVNKSFPGYWKQLALAGFVVEP